MVKNLVRWHQIFEVLQLQPQKNVQSNRIYVSVGIVGLSCDRARQWTTHRTCEKVEFLDCKTPDFMSPCYLVLTR